MEERKWRRKPIRGRKANTKNRGNRCNSSSPSQWPQKGRQSPVGTRRSSKVKRGSGNHEKLLSNHRQLCFRPRVQHSVYKLTWAFSLRKHQYCMSSWAARRTKNHSSFSTNRPLRFDKLQTTESILLRTFGVMFFLFKIRF